ncbi:MAG: glycosyltransferase [Acidimicrobiia bacterium]
MDIVFPAHDEEGRIERTLAAYTSSLTDPATRFVVAMDGCTDRTADVVDALAAADPRVERLEFPKLGKGGVLMEAFRHCDAGLVAFVDADGATPPAEMNRLLDACDGDGADVAIATRRHPASVTPCRRARRRKVASAGFAFGIRRLFRLDHSDTQCGAKVIRAETLHRVLPLLSSRDFLFDVDLLVTARDLGCDVVEVPTIWLDQRGSRVNAAADARRMLKSALRLWFHRRVLPAAPAQAPGAGPVPAAPARVVELRDRAGAPLEAPSGEPTPVAASDEVAHVGA